MPTILLIIIFIVFLAMVILGQRLAQWIFVRFFKERRETSPVDAEEGL